MPYQGLQRRYTHYSGAISESVFSKELTGDTEEILTHKLEMLAP